MQKEWLELLFIAAMISPFVAVIWPVCRLSNKEDELDSRTKVI